MSIDLTITNFLGCRRAEIELEGIALVCARNHSGKTSIAQAAAAVFGGDPVPYDELRLSHAGMILTSGAASGSVELHAPWGTSAVTYPAGKVRTDGTPAVASPYALGRRTLDRLEPRERARVLLDYLKAAPTPEDLATAAREIGLTEPQIVALQQRVKDLDWDGALADVREKGTKLKGQWHQIAKENYGPAKAQSWLPARWETGLEGASEESLQAALTEAREWHEGAVAAGAVGQAERDRLTALAAERPGLEADVEAAQTRLAELERIFHDRKAELDRLPRPTEEERLVSCPHCLKDLVIRNGTPTIPTQNSAAENASLAETLRLATTALASVRSEREAARSKLSVAEGRLRATEIAAKQISAWTAPSDDEPRDLERAREGVVRAEGRLKAFLAHRDAGRIAKAIATNAKIQEILAPDGLRQRKLSGAISGFNGVLAARCALARWPTVEIDQELVIYVGGRALVLASKSERWMARVILQVAMAEIDESAALVVDEADILNKSGRNGLIRLLSAAGRPALVCMTMERLADVPSMRGRGAAYWIENGVAERVADEVT